MLRHLAWLLPLATVPLVVPDAAADDTLGVTAFLGDRPQPSNGNWLRNSIGVGAAVAHVPDERGFIVRAGVVAERDLACSLGEGWTFVEGCGGDLVATIPPQPPTPYGDAVTELGLQVRAGWREHLFAFEAGATARTDSLRHETARRDWLFAPDLVARLSFATSDLSLGLGTYDVMTLVSPGAYVRARWMPSEHATLALAIGDHEFAKPWGEHPHLRIDLDALAHIGSRRPRALFGGGFAILRGGADGLTTTTAIVHLTVGTEL